MGSLKRLFFFAYVAYTRSWEWCANHLKSAAPPVFIWKDFWFLSWHIFFWSFGRKLLAHFIPVTPLVHELPPAATRHYERFHELAHRDAVSRSIDQRIIKPTRYALAPDTAKELCLFYRCIADMAPWQYGLLNRLRSVRRMRNASALSFLLLLSSFHFYSPGSVFLARLVLVCFFALLISLASWRASSALCAIAREANRLQSETT